MGAGGWFAEAGADLLRGGRCLGCERPGLVWCRGCDAALLASGHGPPLLPGCRVPATAHPVAGLRAGAAYAAPVSALVVGHKERGLAGALPPLATLLAAAVLAVPGVGHAGRPGERRLPLLLVPVPSRPDAVRARGRDAGRALARAAAALLRAAGTPASVVPLLATRPGLRDQGGLDAAARAVNLAGGLRCPSHRLRAAAVRRPRVAGVVVVDDVVTTGATLVEATRVLAASGLPGLGCATAAATLRTAVLRASTDEPAR
ncbi:phosphoribosyltransferase family protein [Nocardioides sp. GY 10127]|uniref:phosphoribosyltransferase family protein n=1 Tax=Nocardioides sp. GY 10127 TaxID=2569762 RepID=UPI001F0D59F3|nr:phosphoribosyltransferase family protein [Nocardioides sp. GY 10127]